MDNIGKFLREKRLEKGLSFEDITNKTRLQSSVLQKIEENDFSELGGEGYTKILISSYARVLGLNDKEMESVAGIKCKDNVCIQSSDDEPLYPVKFLFHKNMLLGLLLLAMIVVLTVVVINMYREDKIGLPFKGRQQIESQEQSEPASEEASEPQDEGQIETSDEGALLDEGKPDTELSPIYAENEIEQEDSEIVTNVSEIVEIKVSAEKYLQDRTDYLTDYLGIEAQDWLFSQDENLVSKYLASN
jgi:cytoskeletal protein RodZ